MKSASQTLWKSAESLLEAPSRLDESAFGTLSALTDFPGKSHKECKSSSLQESASLQDL